MVIGNGSTAPQRSTAVLVTNQFECERIINAAKKLSDSVGTELVILSVQSNEYPPNPEAINYLFEVSSRNQAIMNVVYSENIFKTIIEYIKANKAVNVVSGMPGKERSVLHRLWNKFNNISFYTVDNKSELLQVTTQKNYSN